MQRVLCLQEWDKLVAKSLGAKYVKLASESLMAISILVYVRVKLQDHLSAVATSYVATGEGSGSQLQTIQKPFDSLADAQVCRRFVSWDDEPFVPQP